MEEELIKQLEDILQDVYKKGVNSQTCDLTTTAKRIVKLTKNQK